MAKAYSEIVAKARDFAGLFARLLPSPNRETFTDILRSVRNLDELEDSLRQLDEQRSYVAGLAELTEALRSQRETIARYRWLATHGRLSEATAVLEQNSRRIAETQKAIELANVQVAHARARVEAAANDVAAALSSDAEGLGRHMRDAEARFNRLAADHAACARELRAQDETVAVTYRAAAEAARAQETLLRTRTAAARDAAERVRSLATPLTALIAAIAADEGRSAGREQTAFPPIGEPAVGEVDNAIENATRSLRDAEPEQPPSEVPAPPPRHP